MIKKLQNGFTLVELMVVIVVIVILASITVVSYNGVQKNAAVTAATSALDSARETIDADIAYDENHAAPSALPGDIPATQNNVTLTYKLVGGSGKYTGLTDVQNGVLFATICSNLINQSRPDVPELKYGQGYQVNYLGQHVGVVNYLWGPDTCHVYNKGDIQINASWGSAGTTFTVPLIESRVLQEATKTRTDISTSDFPDYNNVANQFYQTLHDEFLAQGGAFPITTFWDSWANSSNGGVMQQSLPPIDTSVPTGYCLQAQSTKYNSVIYRVTNTNSRPAEGSC